MRDRRGALGDHELVTSPKYCGKWLVDENKWWRVKQTYQKQICNNRSGECNFFTKRYYRCTKGILLCAECYATYVLDTYTQELNHQLISWLVFTIFLIYDVITIPIIFQLTQELESICGQGPKYSLRLFLNCLRQIFFPMDNQMWTN